VHHVMSGRVPAFGKMAVVMILSPALARRGLPLVLVQIVRGSVFVRIVLALTLTAGVRVTLVQEDGENGSQLILYHLAHRGAQYL
jgi:hypothetical protein